MGKRNREIGESPDVRGASRDWKEGEKCATYAAKGKMRVEKEREKKKKGSEGRRQREIPQFLKRTTILKKRAKSKGMRSRFNLMEVS